VRVIFNTYPMAFVTPGGGERQIIDYHEALSDFGVTSMMFDLWNPRLDEVDIVHFFSVIGGSEHFCKFIKDRGIPLVISPNLWITPETAHEFPVGEIKSQLLLADKVVVNSDSEIKHYMDVFSLDRDKLIAIHSFVPESFMVAEDPDMVRGVLNIQEDFILSVGNLEPRKNQLSLIKAIKEFPHLKLLLIGHIRDEVYAEKCFAEAGDQVIYAGAIPHNARLLRSAMAACKVFVLTSLVESPSVASIEAAAQGAPIIITQNGSARDYFGDLAVYIDPTDHLDISKAIKVVTETQERSENLRDFVKTRYGATQSAEKLAKQYRLLLQEFEC
jgi:glycosyltransferase involved in cell wall biosynthesis